MCVMSAIHDYGSKLPLPLWDQPLVYPAFQDLIKRAAEFDKVADQPHCEDPEKLKFLEKIKPIEPLAPAQTMRERAEALEAAFKDAEAKTLAGARAEADKLRDEVRSLKRALALAEKDVATQQEAVMEAHADHEQTKDDFDALKIGYARLAIDAGLKVKVSGSGEWFSAIEIELPTGPVRFHVDNQYGDLLTGLPYGLVEKGAIDRDTQALRLTQAFHYDFDQALIPEPITPEKVLSIFPVEPAEAVIIGDPNSGALVAPRPNGLGLILTGDGHGLVLPEIEQANRRYGIGDITTMLDTTGIVSRYAQGGVTSLTAAAPVPNGGAVLRVNGEIAATIGNHANNGKHVG